MSLIIGTAVFIGGLLLGVRVIAGLYSVRDLWYRIGIAWPVVLRRSIGWAALTALVWVLLDRGWRWVFIAGIATHILVNVVAVLTIVQTGARNPRPTRVIE